MIYVIEIRFPVTSGEVPSSPEKQMSNLLTLVHRAAKGRKFAIGLPEYKDGEHRALGQFLQIFSFESAEMIKAIMSDHRLSMFIMDWCETSPVRAVSDADITSWVAYRKSQLAKKRSASHQRRAARRKVEGKRTEDRPFVESIRSQRSMEHLPRFSHYSQGRDMEVPLFIEASKSVCGANPKFDSFGLALFGSC